MTDFKIGVGINVENDSLRKIQSDITNAIRGISPSLSIDIDENKIKRFASGLQGIFKFEVEQIKLSDAGAKSLKASLSQVTRAILIDKIGFDPTILSQLKKDLQTQLGEVSIKAQAIDASISQRRTQSEASSDTPEVQKAFDAEINRLLAEKVKLETKTANILLAINDENEKRLNFEKESSKVLQGQIKEDGKKAQISARELQFLNARVSRGEELASLSARLNADTDEGRAVQSRLNAAIAESLRQRLEANAAFASFQSKSGGPNLDTGDLNRPDASGFKADDNIEKKKQERLAILERILRNDIKEIESSALRLALAESANKTELEISKAKDRVLSAIQNRVNAEQNVQQQFAKNIASEAGLTKLTQEELKSQGVLNESLSRKVLELNKQTRSEYIQTRLGNQISLKLQEEASGLDKSVDLRGKFNNALREAISKIKSQGGLQGVDIKQISGNNSGLNKIAETLDSSSLREFAAAAKGAEVTATALAKKQNDLIIRYRELKDGISQGSVSLSQSKTKMAQLSAEAKRLGISLKDINGGSKEAEGGLQKMLGAVGQAAKRFLLFAIISRIFFGLASEIREAVGEIVKLDTVARRLTIFRAIGEDIKDVGFDRLKSQTSQANKALREIISTSKQTGIGLQAIGEALVTTARVGRGGNKAFQEAVISLVRLEGGALSAETATKNLNAISIQYLDTLAQFTDGVSNATSSSERLAEQQNFIGASIKNASALISSTASRSSADVEQLTDAVTRVGAAFANIQGVNLETTLGLVGSAFNATGANAGRLATTLRQVLTLSAKNADQIKETAGINITDDSGQLRSFDAILEVLGKINDLGRSAEGVELASQIADRRNVGDVFALAAGAKDLAAQYSILGKEGAELAIVTRAVGEQFDANALLSDSLEANIQKLKSTFVELFANDTVVSFFNKVVKGATTLIEVYKTLATTAGDLGGKFIDFVDSTSVFIAITNPITAVIKGFVSGFRLLFDTIEGGVNLLTLAGAKIDDLLNSTRKASGTFDVNSNVDQEEENARERILKKDAAIFEARKQQRIKSEAEAKKAKVAEALNLAQVQKRTDLLDDLSKIQARIASGNLSEVETVNALAQKESAIAKLKAAGFEGSSLAKNAEKELLKIKTLSAIKDSQIAATLAKQAALRKIILDSTSSGAQKIQFESEFDTNSLRNELDRVREKIQEDRKLLAFVVDTSGEINKRIIDNEGKVEEIRTKIVYRELSATKERIGLELDAADKQFGLFETATSNLVSAFQAISSIQKDISDIFGERVSSAVGAAATRAEGINTFLESAGASVEARLAAVATQSNTQLETLRRLGSQQLNAISGGSAGSIGQIADALIASSESIGKRAGDKLVDQTKQSADFGLFAARQRNAEQKGLFDLAVSQAKDESSIRKDILKQEIQIVTERIQKERELLTLQENQQRSFGKFLINSAPEDIQSTKGNVDITKSFFGGFNRLNSKSTKDIVNAVRSGQIPRETLGKILSGLDSIGQFGLRTPLQGAGIEELQSIIERAANPLVDPGDIVRSLERQRELSAQATALQEENLRRQAELDAISRGDFELQKQVLRVQVANVEIAKAQRNDILRALFSIRGDLRDQLLLADAQIGIVSRGSGDEFGAIVENIKSGFQSAIEATKLGSGELESGSPKFDVLISSLSDATDSIDRLRTSIEGEERQSSNQSFEGIENILGGDVRSNSNGTGFNILADRIGQLIAIQERGEQLTQDQRNELRRLLIQSKQNFGGQFGGQKALRSQFKNEEVRDRAFNSIKGLLEDTPSESDVIDRVRRLRGEGEGGAKNVDFRATKKALQDAGLKGLAEGVNNKGQAVEALDRLISLSESIEKNNGQNSKRITDKIIQILGNEFTAEIKRISDRAVEEVGRANPKIKVRNNPIGGNGGNGGNAPGNGNAGAGSDCCDELKKLPDRIATSIDRALANNKTQKALTEALQEFSVGLSNGVPISFIGPLEIAIESVIRERIENSDEIAAALIEAGVGSREMIAKIKDAISRLFAIERLRGENLPVGDF